MAKAKLYTIGDITDTNAGFAARVGLSDIGMRKRIYQCRHGQLTDEQALAPRFNNRNMGNDEWGALSNQARTDNLKVIPEPTRFERG